MLLTTKAHRDVCVCLCALANISQSVYRSIEFITDVSLFVQPYTGIEILEHSNMYGMDL